MIAVPTYFAVEASRVLIPPRIAVSAGQAASGGYLHALSGRCMGTSWSVRLVCASKVLPESLKGRVVQCLEDVEAQMSHFRAQSALSRFGRLPAGDSMVLPEAFAQVMQAALQVALLSDGAFDPTLAPAINAWGFGQARHFTDSQFVSPQVAGAGPCGGGWRLLRLADSQHLLQPGGVQLNLSAIAKGFAVDQVSALLCRAGLENHLVEVGGELRGMGMKPEARPWWVGLESPAAGGALPATRIALCDLAVATSGDYRRFFMQGGRRMHHTIDPQTGAPTQGGLASVSVMHEHCMMADAWATAIMVKGPEQGLALADAQGLRAILQWQTADGVWQEAVSRAAREMVQ